MVNDKAAYVQYVSHTQINAFFPADSSAGPLAVRVTSNGQKSDPATVIMHAVSPAWFRQVLAATHADASLLDKSGSFRIRANSDHASHARRNDHPLRHWLGAANPASRPGQTTSALSPLAT